MFEKFGEFDSAEEINMAAEGLKNEGDIETLKALCLENGIYEGIAMMYASNEVPYVTEPASAAIGKLEIEAEELKAKELMCDWIEYIKEQCFENMDLAKAVRSKKKNLAGCIAKLLKYSFENQIDVPSEVIKAADIKASKVTFGVPSMGSAKKIIKKYYLGE